MIAVDGKLVTMLEFDTLATLAVADKHMTAADVGAALKGAVGPPGWTALRMLDSLKMRGLVEWYMPPNGARLSWRLTSAARKALKQ